MFTQNMTKKSFKTLFPR